MEKSITFIGDEYRDLIRSRKITAYIMLRNYVQEPCRVGEVLRLNVFDPKGEALQCVAKVTVVKVRFYPLMQFEYPDLVAAGFASTDEVIQKFCGAYPSVINRDTDMIWVGWRDVIPQGGGV